MALRTRIRVDEMLLELYEEGSEFAVHVGLCTPTEKHAHAIWMCGCVGCPEGRLLLFIQAICEARKKALVKE